MVQGFAMFPNPPVYGWFLSTGAIFLNTSWSMHNLIAWMKNKPFLSKRVSRIYIITVILVQPYWILEITANFLYFNNINEIFRTTRPYEALFRDPWWIFTCCSLFWNIKRRYDFGILELCRVSPRFAILLMSMTLSVTFIICDILSVVHVIHTSPAPDGINPWWKLSFVFKCLTDAVILDDFKTALDRLKRYRMRRMNTSGSLTLEPPTSTTDRMGSDAYPLPLHRFDTLQSYPDCEAANVTAKPLTWAELADLTIEDVDTEMQRPMPTMTRSLPMF